MDALVYTDGSCSAKDRVGGYAYKIVVEDEEYLGGGSEVDTTISRMELMAAISGPQSFAHETYGPCYILLHSDSEYVVKGFMNSQRKRNKNVDLWLELDEVGSHT
jgi:ribonuclease HI